MDEYWTQEQKAEWKARSDAAAEGSQERAQLDDMMWTGFFQSATPDSPVSPAQSPLPSQVMQAPAAPTLPPLAPVPAPAQDPDEAVKKAQMNAFFDKKPFPTPDQIADIRAKAQPGPQIPPGGIGFGMTRRNVPTLGLPTGGERYKTRKSKKGGQIVTVFFNIRDQVKMYHWQTKSFSEHKATDDLVGKLDTNIDSFVEVYMGRYGRPLIKKTLPVKNLTVTGIRTFIARSSKWLETSLPRMLKRTDSDLLNVRDEILADLNQIKYLFTLS